MKPCPVCSTEVEDLYTGFCPNEDCPWEFELVSEITPEMHNRYEEKLQRAKRFFVVKNNFIDTTKIEPTKSNKLILSFINSLLKNCNRYDELRKLTLQKIEYGKSKYSKIGYYRCLLSDGKGVLILHADGDFISQIFYIRKGIGYYYRLNFEKINSNLGLPISSESEMMDSTNTKTDFENGYIKWISKENTLMVYYKKNQKMILFDKYTFTNKK